MNLFQGLQIFTRGAINMNICCSEVSWEHGKTERLTIRPKHISANLDKTSINQSKTSNKTHIEALTITFLLTASFPSFTTNRFFSAPYLQREKDYKTGWKALCWGMYYILGGFLDGIGSACMWCCREFEGYRSVARLGKKADEIKRNDVAHLLYLYSISSPQTAGPGCWDERLSGGQERRSWVRRKMASGLSNAWKHNPSHAPSSWVWTYLWKPCHFR